MTLYCTTIALSFLQLSRKKYYLVSTVHIVALKPQRGKQPKLAWHHQWLLPRHLKLALPVRLFCHPCRRNQSCPHVHLNLYQLTCLAMLVNHIWFMQIIIQVGWKSMCIKEAHAIAASYMDPGNWSVGRPYQRSPQFSLHEYYGVFTMIC